MNRLHIICLSAIFLSLPCFLWKAKADNAIDYSPGEISYQETISPTGGRIYAVPLLTTPYASSAPQISLLYNSQAGNGIAGYGWNIGGLSSITITIE